MRPPPRTSTSPSTRRVARRRATRCRRSRVLSSDFEANNGGFVGAGTSSSWAWGTPTTGPGSAHSGTRVWATNLTGNYNLNENSTLTSPTIDLSAYAGQCRRRSVGGSGCTPRTTWDFASVEVSKNGGSTWTTVYGPVSGTIDSAWTRHSVALDSSYAVSGFRMRFHLTRTSRSSTRAGMSTTSRWGLPAAARWRAEWSRGW